MADAMEIVCDDNPVETEFNEVLVDYLDVQRRSSSDEDSSDRDESSSGNDSDIGHAISTDIVEDGGGGRAAAACHTRPADGLYQ